MRGRKEQAALWLDGRHELRMIPVGRSRSCVRSGNAPITVSQQDTGLVAGWGKQLIYEEITLLLSKAVAILRRSHPPGHSPPSRDRWRFRDVNFRGRLKVG